MAATATATPSLPPVAPQLLRELVQVQRILGRRGLVRFLTCLGRRLPQVLRHRSLGPADALMRGPLSLRTEGGPLRIDCGDFGVVREIFGSRCYAFADWIQQSRTILDLGANEGLFVLQALTAAPHSRVTAVEAQPSLCARLADNLRRNGFQERARVIHGLAGDLNSQLAKLPDTAPPLDMDALITELGAVDFLKIDIEGSEFALFARSQRWIPRVRFIAMEIHHGAGDSVALQRQLMARGLAVRHSSTHGSLGYLFLENPVWPPA
jgi:hypothetical protein